MARVQYFYWCQLLFTNLSCCLLYNWCTQLRIDIISSSSDFVLVLECLCIEIIEKILHNNTLQWTYGFLSNHNSFIVGTHGWSTRNLKHSENKTTGFLAMGNTRCYVLHCCAHSRRNKKILSPKIIMVCKNCWILRSNNIICIPKTKKYKIFLFFYCFLLHLYIVLKRLFYCLAQIPH